MKLFLPPLVAVALLLTGCGAATVKTVVVCPPLPDWSPAEQAQVADEMDAAPAASAWPDAIVQLVTLRDAVKACAQPKE